jgi:acetyl-CoA acetyltransferase
MKAVILAKQLIQLGEAEVLIAGGIENMSQAPKLQRFNYDTFRPHFQQLSPLLDH